MLMLRRCLVAIQDQVFSGKIGCFDVSIRSELNNISFVPQVGKVLYFNDM